MSMPTKPQVVEVLELHRIECTGPGEVTCRNCRQLSWMSWYTYHEHLADLILAIGGPRFCEKTQNCRMAAGHDGGCERS